MIFPANFEQKTGFDKIRHLINNNCISSLGKEQVDEMFFSSDLQVVTEKLTQTAEFVRIVQEEDSFPADYFMDVREALRRIRPEGAFLDEKELFDLKRSLQTIYDITRFFKRQDDVSEVKYPALTALSGNIPVFPAIIRQIDGILDKYGRVKDNASHELMRIRKDMFAVTGSISRNLQSILRAAQSEGFVDKDVAPTMRDGRLVIPVSPAFKRRIKGIVHDESATGKTVFIEPEAVVEANNRIRELENEEKREVMRILVAFTDTVRPSVPELLQSFVFLATVDFIRAKALFAIKVNAIKPVVDDKPLIDWMQAIHPLLYLSHQKQAKQVVPLDITLYDSALRHCERSEAIQPLSADDVRDSARILIISGPNAGGKSVCLKTVGLLQYMLQCGLLIPVHERSRAGIFDKLFIDIGDEQSIENDLSTYSSHLINMKFFTRNTDDRTLLLIDEFGSGTEPLIGGAIAESILERFNSSRSFGVITTHYHNLKQYADKAPGIVNGAMLYDRHLMQPLFRLSIGNPGSSFAIEIARKIGLSEDIITDASQKVGSDYIDMDKYLQDIVRDKRYWENKRQSIRQQEKKLEDLTARYIQDLEAINKQRKEMLTTAKTQAAQILADANAKIEQTIREIKEANAEKEKTKAIRRSFNEFREAVSEERGNGGNRGSRGNRGNRESRGNGEIVGANLRVRPKSRENRKNQTTPNPPSFSTLSPFGGGRGRSQLSTPNTPLSPGDSVRLKGQQAIGTILETDEKKSIVAFGTIKSTLDTDRLEKVNKNQTKKESPKSTFISAHTADSMYEKKLHFKLDIDVRGMRGDEALQAVTYFIDDAIQINAGRVRILHGTGNGILRHLIREYLATVPGIKHFNDEHVQFGGTGITVVDIE